MARTTKQTRLMVSGRGIGRPVEAREYAHRYAGQAVGLLAHALNHCTNEALPYRYDEQTQERFLELATAIARLIESGTIIDRRATIARADKAFQCFLAGVVRRRRKFK